MKPPTIVIVEHEPETRDLLLLAFESRGYMTWSCGALDMAIALFLAAQPDVVLINLEGDEEHFLNLLQVWKRAAPRTQLIVQTSEADDIQKQNVLDHGAYAYLLRPVTPEALFEALNGPEAEPAAPAVERPHEIVH